MVNKTFLLHVSCSFTFYSSKKQSDTDTRSPLPIDLYLLQEFQAMDKDNKGRLNLRQFTNLLLYLGFYQPADRIRVSDINIQLFFRLTMKVFFVFLFKVKN